ncbi:hypothetical protein NDU88_004889 [Pleurodeles waltl]|uniref:RNase H type-1 domain-containing protein n=1 Tax=Pleurodeles waltl TaxID=8319 RepID=A0AAV7T8W5_PLEWA|nr:hypothetical protein NDU88_004889 [Pleurodeles waltl]
MRVALILKYYLGQNPLAYYSRLLDSVMQGYFPCEQALAAAVNKSTSIVMGAPLTLYAEHPEFTVIQKSKSTLTTQQVSRYKLMLSRPLFKIVWYHLVNPATFLVHEVKKGEETHNGAIYTPEGICQAEDDPILDSEVLFVNKFSTIDQETGVRHTGAAVVMAHSHAASETLHITAQLTLLSHFSAQTAELTALIEAFTQSSGKMVTIYSDSAYVTTTVHSGIGRWRRQGFLTSDGTPVAYRVLLEQLIDVLTLPKRVTMVKCGAHMGGRDFISWGMR